MFFPPPGSATDILHLHRLYDTRILPDLATITRAGILLKSLLTLFSIHSIALVHSSSVILKAHGLESW